jgi:hypothetical protein
MIRIYNKGDTVDLSVPAQAGGSTFEGWNMIGARVDEPALKSPSLRLNLDDHVLTVSHWARSGETKGPTMDLSRFLDPATLARAASEAPTEELRMPLRTRSRRLHAVPCGDPALSSRTSGHGDGYRDLATGCSYRRAPERGHWLAGRQLAGRRGLGAGGAPVAHTPCRPSR